MPAMVSFKDIRESIVSCYVEDMLDDEKFFGLYDFYSSKNPDFRTIPTLHVTLAKWMIQNALLSLESINVISLLLLIILEYLTTSIVNSALWVTESKDSVCYYDKTQNTSTHTRPYVSLSAC